MMPQYQPLVLAVICLCGFLPTSSTVDSRSYMHPKPVRQPRDTDVDNLEGTSEFWQQKAQDTLKSLLEKQPNTNVAKNVILFLGDGMSVPTIAASRVYAFGNENGQLAFDEFPYTAMSKTYCVDNQVADSACTSTAYLSGVKGNYATIGVNGQVEYEDCEAMRNESNHVLSIGYWSQLKGKGTGLVTTTTVTNASPAGFFGHTANRNWESDTDVILSGVDPEECMDLARQLVTGEVGRNMQVILGGGRGNFIPKTFIDEEGISGHREDDSDLIGTWLGQKIQQNETPAYFWSREELLGLDNKTTSLLGLFETSHCNYNLERDQDLDPSLEEMTEAAIKVLQKNPNGYFLFVEGGLIDHGHHDSRARIALDETVEFSKAVQKAVDMTSEEDTLIVVTSDHAHTMSYSGYSPRGYDVLGLNSRKATDGIAYLTLNYANGPGYREQSGDRYDPSGDTFDKDYAYPGISPQGAETHAGDDVVIFARGPWAHLFSGVVEQNVIPEVMKFASCVGDGLTVCDTRKAEN